MSTLGWCLVGTGIAIPLYAYVTYPIFLALLGLLPKSGRRRAVAPNWVCPTQGAGEAWPSITITLPVYNEEHVIAETLECLLEADYPPERRYILVISDASTDRTEEIVARYRDRGVGMVRLPERGGKTAAENASRLHLTGELVVNTDASVRIARNALKPLIAAFSDPTVGVASGRDVSVSGAEARANVGESGYVGYEMWVRDLETRVGGIVGASGCFFASRRDLHGEIVPAALSRDFAAPLIARENGYRSVSVRDAVCFVPRTPSVRREYRRKVRTMARGIETLFYKRHLMNPFRYGVFAWMLMSHKLVRWVMPAAALMLAVGLALLATQVLWARWGLAAVVGSLLLAGVAWLVPEETSLPRVLSVPGYVVSGLIAGMAAWARALRRELDPIWEPTRRG